MENRKVCELEGCENFTQYSKWERKYNRFCCGSHASKHNNAISKEKREQTNIERHGNKVPSKTNKVKQKTKESNNAKYGCHPSELPETHVKIKATTFERLGVEHGSQSPIIKEKQKATCRKNFGVDHPMQSPIVREKSKATSNIKYGTDFPIQSESVKKKVAASMAALDKDELYRSHVPEQYLDKLRDRDWLEEQIKIQSPRELAAMVNLSYPHVCSILKDYGLNSRCSYFEKEVKEYVQSLSGEDVIKENDRSLLSGKEIDLLMAKHNFAIECNGTYFHSELNGKDRTYHFNKTRTCNLAGIDLIHVWHHDWEDKKELVKNVIKTKLNVLETLQLDTYLVSEIDTEQSDLFLENNHILSSVKSDVGYGIFKEDTLVSVMTFSKCKKSSKFKCDWELNRHCDLLGFKINNSAEILFKKFLEDQGSSSVILNSNKDWGLANEYSDLGFVLKETRQAEYKYTTDYHNFFDKKEFSKKKLKDKLEVYDENLSEWKNMKNNKYDRVWDSGTDVWIFKRN